MHFGPYRKLVALSLCGISALGLGVNIEIVVEKSLQFSAATSGDPPETITPNAPGAARFLVTGDAGESYTIALPQECVMTAPGGPANIRAYDFTSMPATTGVLGPGGQQYLYVGATREAIGPGQIPDPFEKHFNVAVKYIKRLPTRSATTTCSFLLMASIFLSKISDLNFGEGVQGDNAKTISPSAVGAASFNVSGQASAAFSIQLPPNGTVTMITGAGDTPQKRIAVDNFVSNPSGTGVLNAVGAATFGVGATRPALLSNQQSGDYVGTFTVTVAYQ